jgi:hypothetical protein
MGPPLTIVAYIYVKIIQIEYCLLRLRVNETPCASNRLKAHIARALTNWLLVTFLLCNPAPATSIKILRGYTEIVIGADSKANIGSGSFFACKIVQAGSVFIVASGIAENRVIGFNALAIAQQACGTDGTISQKADRVQKALLDPFIKVLDRARQLFQQDYERKREEGANRLSVTLCTIENNIPTLVVIDFEVDTPANERPVVRPTRKVCPGECPPIETLVDIGSQQASKAFLAQNPAFWDTYDSVTGIRKLIEVEIEANPAEVGSPIDILRITKDGAYWVQKKPQCPDIQTYVHSDTSAAKSASPTTTTDSSWYLEPPYIILAVIVGLLLLGGFYSSRIRKRRAKKPRPRKKRR